MLVKVVLYLLLLNILPFASEIRCRRDSKGKCPDSGNVLIFSNSTHIVTYDEWFGRYKALSVNDRSRDPIRKVVAWLPEYVFALLSLDNVITICSFGFSDSGSRELCANGGDVLTKIDEVSSIRAPAVAVDPIHGILFWSSANKAAIRAFDIVSKQEANAVDHLSSEICSMTADGVSQLLFWFTCSLPCTVERSNMNGTERKAIFQSADQFVDITIDIEHGVLYLASFGRIASVGYDGTGYRIVTTHDSIPEVSRVVYADHKLYWTNAEQRYIYRYNIDVGTIHAVPTDVPITPLALAVDVRFDRRTEVGTRFLSGLGSELICKSTMAENGLFIAGICTCRQGFKYAGEGCCLKKNKG